MYPLVSLCFPNVSDELYLGLQEFAAALSQSPFIIYELLLLNEIKVEYQSLVNNNEE